MSNFESPTPPPQAEPEPSPEPKAERKRSVLPIVAAVAAAAVVGGASGAGVTALVLGNGQDDGTSSLGPQTITVNDYDDPTLVSAVAANAIDSVVTISVSGQVGSGTGSGVVIDDAGHIVTNTHVVTLDGQASNPSIRVTTSSGRVYDATIVGTDPILDLAVIRVDGASELRPIEFGDSDELNVGDVTIAIGAPLGLSGTVTSGIISSLDRSIQVASSAVPEAPPEPSEPEAPEGGDPFDFFNFDIPGAPQPSGPSGIIQLPVIQTDTAINRGNSGGALLDAQGRLIGINVAIATGGSGTGNIGVGFALPSNVAKRVATEIIETGVATHGLLGATVSNVADDPSQRDADVIGASIVELTAGGAAEQAGLRVGDIIVSLDGVPIRSKTDLTAQVRSHAAGATLEVEYVRGGQSHSAEVTLGALDG